MRRMGVNKMDKKDEIKREVGFLKQDAEEGKIEALLFIRIDRDHRGRATPTVTILVGGEADEAQVDMFRTHLHGIAEIFREIYNKPPAA